MKKTILHIIDNLNRGGAEIMLVTVAKNLKEYNNVIVTLYPGNEFEGDLKCDHFVCLNLTSNFSIGLAVLKMKKIIKQHKIDIVHSHLFWSTVVARLSTPKKIPLITTIHCFVASSLEYRPMRMHLIEKLTYKIRTSTIVAVAKGALDEYFNFINVKPYKACSLYTFVDTALFNEDELIEKKETSAAFRIISVGNLKEQKNHSFLLEAFRELRNENISLDIYGKGKLEASLQKTIEEQSLNVTLKGQVKDIQKHIQQYDLFVMSSLYEGFALSVLEAMALRMPILLSDIVSFREQCADTAIYYDVNNTRDFVSKLLFLKNNRQQLIVLGNAAKERVLKNFTLEQHLNHLKAIYTEALTAA